MLLYCCFSAFLLLLQIIANYAGMLQCYYFIFDFFFLQNFGSKNWRRPQAIWNQQTCLEFAQAMITYHTCTLFLAYLNNAISCVCVPQNTSNKLLLQCFLLFFFVELKLVSIPYQIIRSNSCFISPLFLLHLSIFLDILSWIDRSHLVFFSNVVLPCCFISDELLLWRALGALTRLIKYFEWLDCINSPEIQGKFSESVLNL